MVTCHKKIETKDKSPVVRELKIIKNEIRGLKNENKLTNLKIRAFENKLKDEAALIKEQNLEFKDEILGEIKAMREELTITLGQYSRHEETLEEHEERISHLEPKPVFP